MKVPRKLDVLIKFYKQTISNEKISHRVRMQAAERLSGIYTAHMIQAEKAAARKAKAEARALAQQGQHRAILPQESNVQANDDEKIASIFNSLLSPKGGSADATK